MAWSGQFVSVSDGISFCLQELVSLVRESITHLVASDTLNFLDIGSGSGAILIALLDLFPEARFDIHAYAPLLWIYAIFGIG